jgi:hypothetical protein
MDMSVSPDLEAFCCYGLVFLLGLATAWGQVSKRLGRLPGQWIMLNTWLLFFAYTFVPVALFWFLDRTNAIHDTSLFAAVLVGVGYQQILSGSIGSIRAPGDISKFWQPFGAWADTIAVRIRDRIIVNNSRFDEKLLSTIRSDAGKFGALKSVAMVHASDVLSVNQSLQAIAATEGVLGADGVQAKQASFLYENLKQSSPQQFEYLLYKTGVIPRKWFLWYAQEWRSKTTAIAVAVILLLLGVGGALWMSTPPARARYYVWRLHKDNGTDYDRYRAQKKLSGYLANTPPAYSDLIGLLRVPNLPVTTADRVLGLLLETRREAWASKVDLQGMLVESLRTENSDVRTRIQKLLLYLADEKQSQVPTELQNWRSDPKNTSTDVDQVIKKWQQVNWK